ncbi:esterase [Synechococcus sp. RSCCF101]|uniref:alpha/beta hydrolase n=1 Tax=Synechococcus sp. RSCCF101 TaxID=2511069 RepID=UPI0012468149|nr:dienelactone hydrolase family protein [Synechococcus sp. RSCCF101]QEY32285.1 esterase [Synechococcus sp. RSCCF101]
MELSCIRRGARPAQARLVLLHGWGADADNLMPLAEELLPDAGAAGVELLALRAPGRHPDGVGRAWYDLSSPVWDGLTASRDLLRQTLLDLGAEIPLSRTAILGFSQGAAMAVDVACRLPVALILACSAYPHPEWSPPERIPPIWFSHGRQDPVVPEAAGRSLAEQLRGRGGAVSWTDFSGGHAIDPSLLQPMRETLISHGIGTRGGTGPAG